MTLHRLVSIAAPAPQGFLGLRFFFLGAALSAASSSSSAALSAASTSMASNVARFCPR